MVIVGGRFKEAFNPFKPFCVFKHTFLVMSPLSLVQEEERG